MLTNQNPLNSKPQTLSVFATSNIQKTPNQIINEYNESAISKKTMNETFISDNNNLINNEQHQKLFNCNKSQTTDTFSSLREKFERISRAEKVFFLIFLNIFVFRV